MQFQVDVVIRGEKQATTHVVEGIANEPGSWTEADVADVLKGMLLVLNQVRNPGSESREVYLRGVSWIVDPYDEGGVVIALEIPTGAAVAGPFDIEQRALESLIARVMEPRAGSASGRVH